MAYNANGLWTAEDDDVGSAVAKTVAADGPLMKQARGLGAIMAGKRGLGNSSIAVAASQNAVLDKASAIGGQTAAQTHAKNLAALNMSGQKDYGVTLQQMQDTAAKERLGMQIGADKDLQTGSLGAQKDIAGMQIASNEKLSANEITARMGELDTRIAADERLAAAGDKSAMDRLIIDTASRETLQRMQGETSIATANIGANASTTAANIGANASLAAAQMREKGDTERLTASLTSQEKQQATGIAGQLELQRDELAARKDISEAERASEMARLTTQIDGELLRQREELTTRKDISDADRAAELGKLNIQIMANKELQQMTDSAAFERQQSSQASAKDLQQTADLGALERQREEIAARKDLSEGDREAELTRLDKQIAGQKELAGLEGTNALERQKLANTGAMDQQRLDSTTKLNIAEIDAKTSRGNTALQAATAASNSYNETFGQILQNDKIPADVRQQAIKAIQAATEAAIGVAEDVGGMDFAWGNNGKVVAPPNGVRPPVTTSIPQGYPGEVQLPNGEWYNPANGFIPV